jgi:hypothetical protein
LGAPPVQSVRCSESGVESAARIEFTANSLLFTVPETRFADCGQNSMILSKFGKIHCFFHCSSALWNKGHGLRVSTSPNIGPRDDTGDSPRTVLKMEGQEQNRELAARAGYLSVAQQPEVTFEIFGRLWQPPDRRIDDWLSTFLLAVIPDPSG